MDLGPVDLIHIRYPLTAIL